MLPSRWNKTTPQLKHTIYRVRNSLTQLEPYLGVVYFLSCNPESVKDVTILEHGNSRKGTMLNRPYIRTEMSVVMRQDALLNDNKRPQVVYDILLEESRAPYRSASMSKEPRNLKQIQTRQTNLKQKSPKSIYPEVYQLQALILSQRNPDSLVKTVTGNRSIVYYFRIYG